MNAKISEFLQEIIKNFSILSFAFYALGVLMVFIYAIVNQIPWSYISEDTSFVFIGLLMYSVMSIVILVAPVLPHLFLISMLRKSVDSPFRKNFYVCLSVICSFLFAFLFTVYTNQKFNIVSFFGSLDFLDLVVVILTFCLFVCFVLGLPVSIVQVFKEKVKLGFFLITSYFISALWISVNLFGWFSFVWRVATTLSLSGHSLLNIDYLRYAFIWFFVFVAFIIYTHLIRELYEVSFRESENWYLEVVRNVFVIPASFWLLAMLFFLFGYKDVVNTPLKVLQMGGSIPVQVILKNTNANKGQTKVRKSVSSNSNKDFEKAKLLWMSTKTIVIKVGNKKDSFIEIIPRENIKKIIFQSD